MMFVEVFVDNLYYIKEVPFYCPGRGHGQAPGGGADP